MQGVILDQATGIPGFALSELMQFIMIFFFCALRIGAFLLASPFFGARSVPLQVRIVTGMVLSFVFFGRIDPMPILNADLYDLVRMITVELFIGISMGLIVSILFASVALAGEKIAASGGLGFAAQVDPTSGGQTPVVSNILTLFLIVIFLSLDGHLALIRAIYASYDAFPIGGTVPFREMSQYGIDAAGEMFYIACVIMLPVVALLLLSNFAIGVVTRSAPQLNLFSFGFPMTMLVVFIALYASATPLGHAMEDLTGFALDYIGGFLIGGRNGE